MGAIWLGLLSMSASGTSVADPAQAPYTRCAGKMASLVVAEQGIVELLVARERLTTIVFPRPVEKEGDGTEAIEIYTLDPDTLLVRPKTHARSDSTVAFKALTRGSALRA